MPPQGQAILARFKTVALHGYPHLLRQASGESRLPLPRPQPAAGIGNWRCPTETGALRFRQRREKFQLRLVVLIKGVARLQ